MGFAKKFINSLYNFKAYNVFIKQSMGKSILYLLILCVCLSTISNIFLAVSFNTTVNEVQDVIKNEVPNFTFNNHKLHVEGEMPIKVEEGNSLIIIDTENDVKTSMLDNYQKGLIITKDKMIQKENNSKISTYDFKQFEDASFTKADVLPLVTTIKNISIPLMFIFFPLFSFIGKLISSFVVMAIGGLIINSILNKNLKYSECAKLGMYSLTVPFLIKIIFSILSIDISLFWVLYYGIALLYLFLGMKAIDDTNDFNQPYEIMN